VIVKCENLLELEIEITKMPKLDYERFGTAK